MNIFVLDLYTLFTLGPSCNFKPYDDNNNQFSCFFSYIFGDVCFSPAAARLALPNVNTARKNHLLLSETAVFIILIIAHMRYWKHQLADTPYSFYVALNQMIPQVCRLNKVRV